MSDYLPENAPTTEEVETQPYNRNAEEAVLGAVLINPEMYYDLAEFLEPDDFFIVRNRWVWQAFQRLQERRTRIDYLTVIEELQQRNQLAELGGSAYLTALLNQTPSSLNAVEYGKIVEEYSIRRRMLSAANDIAKLAYNREQNIGSVLEEAEKHIFGISQKHTRHDVEFIKDVMNDLYDHVGSLA
ncbi:MAG: DnaB-like helicase N-terminal domain-containing protein, partial [Anaerolineaceae bacterium]